LTTDAVDVVVAHITMSAPVLKGKAAHLLSQ